MGSIFSNPRPQHVHNVVPKNFCVAQVHWPRFSELFPRTITIPDVKNLDDLQQQLLGVFKNAPMELCDFDKPLMCDVDILYPMNSGKFHLIAHQLKIDLSMVPFQFHWIRQV